jgi:hypothetical protein
VVTFNLSLSDELGAVLTDPFSEIPVVTDAAERDATRFSHLPAVPVVDVFESFDAMKLHITVLLR